MTPTPRQWDVLRLVAECKSNAAIARELCVGPGTVKAHLLSLYRRIGVRNRTGATMWYVKNGEKA